jgi:hypothetical protein
VKLAGEGGNHQPNQWEDGMIVLSVLAVYAACGLVLGLWFVARGVARIDPLGAEAVWWVRAVWLPGAVGVWPVLLMKVARLGARKGKML